ncbi:MAG TPA: M1 family aminopeptidase [Terriglobales bacterium]|nr:M1 family aminopeptidase [Terriglobales bacterium]
MDNPKGRGWTILRLLPAVLLLASATALGAEAPRIRAEDYKIDAELFPAEHRLKASAQVRFTALDDISTAVFELHNALRPTRVTDAEGHELSVERVTQDSTVRVMLPAGLAKGASSTLTFEYEGILQSAVDSPVYGLSLAYIGADTSYLLYAGRWFPVTGWNLHRFTATMNITVPQGYTVVGSGRTNVVMGGLPAKTITPAQAKGRTQPSPVSREPRMTYSFAWMKPSFPGTIIAGRFQETVSEAGGVTVRTYFKPEHKELVAAYSDTAVKEFQVFSSMYGGAPSPILNLVELPDDTLPSAWAPEIAALVSRALTDPPNYRLLANAIAHQWWGVSVSVASMDNAWLTDGFARYSEARYVEVVAGPAGYQEMARDMSVGALAYDTVPLGSVSRLEPFSPEFQSLVTEKGAMVLHMLRWVMGDTNFDNALRTFATQFAGKAANAEDFRKVAEFAYGETLNPFFSQWLYSTGAPEFKNKYTVYRVDKGFRIVGEISQDLDLFRMPMELRIDTDGPTETRRIEVVGTASPFAVDVPTKPRRIQIDPNNWVLKNYPDLKVRVAILRGQQLVQQGALAEALAEFQKALDANKNSSLAHYRIAEVFFLQRNYQASANSYRDSLSGDGEPRWTEVWSRIQLGKIYDITGQRERAVNEYRQALQTNDNTQGALDEARRYLDSPYTGERKSGL